MEPTFKMKPDVEFVASIEDVKGAAKRMPAKKERPNGYFVEIDGEYFRMKSVLKQLASDKGFELPIVSKDPFYFFENFEELGLRVWKREWLLSAQKALLCSDVRSKPFEIFCGIPEKVYSNTILLGGREFRSFRNFLAFTNLSQMETFEGVEPEEGVLLITAQKQRETEIVFIDNFPNPKRFMAKLSEFVQNFNSILDQSLGEDETFANGEFGKFLKRFSNSGMDFKALKLFEEMLDYSNEGFRICEYAFYSSEGLADEDELKALAEKGNSVWNRRIDFISVKSGLKEDEELTLRISIPGTGIWRKARVKLSTTFEELHRIIQIVMGWGKNHPHAFYFNGDPIKREGSEIGIFLGKKGDRISYIYDFGNEWRLEIKCEKTYKLDPKRLYPICIGGKKGDPSEDLRGSWGYKNIVKSYFDPSDEHNEEAREWLGEGFDPEKFELERINEDLGKFFH